MAHFSNQSPAYVGLPLSFPFAEKREQLVKRLAPLYMASNPRDKLTKGYILWKVLLTTCGGDGKIGSRYIYELYYEKEAISKLLYDWLLKNNYADANLIAKWKKQGYEKVSFGSNNPRSAFPYHPFFGPNPSLLLTPSPGR